MLMQLTKSLFFGPPANDFQSTPNKNEENLGQATQVGISGFDLEEVEIKELAKIKKETHKVNKTLSQDVIVSLVKMGFKMNLVISCWKKTKFFSIPQAVTFLIEGSKPPSTPDHNEQLYKKTTIDKDNKDDFVSDAFSENKKIFRLPRSNEEKIETLLLSDSQTSRSVRHSDDFIKTNAIIISKFDSTINYDELCPICCENSIIQINPKLIFSCSHVYCGTCLEKYLTQKIVNGYVMNMRCASYNCPRIFTNTEIEEIVKEDVYQKYKKFFTRKANLHIHCEEIAIQCPFPDCEEILFFERRTHINAKLVCANGHKFCGKCGDLSWHSGYNCKDYTEEIFKNLASHSQKNQFKLCPRCRVIIEKITNDNFILCDNCKLRFCWLCLERCEESHFAIYNISGCYGKRYYQQGQKEKCKGCRRKTCCTFSFIGIILLYFIIGCSLEFILAYLKFCCREKHEEKDEEKVALSASFSVAEERRKLNFCDYFLCFLLFIGGLVLQPIYLLLYIFLLLINCMKMIGCGMFIFYSGR